MTTYYISPNGSNANNGLGPDASHATNKPWLTLAKATNTGSTVVPGDTVYVAPGYYYSSSMTPISGITSSASPTTIAGDPTNAQGFKDGSGVRLAPGLPWVTTRTSGEGLDSDIASAGNLIVNETNKPAGLQFKKLVLECGSTSSGNVYLFDVSAGANCLFEDCYMIGRAIAAATVGAPTASLNLTFRRCTGWCGQFLVLNVSTAAATANANLNIVVEECLIFGSISSTTFMRLGTAAGNLGGGVLIRNNTIIAVDSNALNTSAGNFSTVTPCTVTGNIWVKMRQQAINAGTAGHVVDGGYNRYFASTANTNVTTGTGTVFGVAPNLVLPHLVMLGLEMPRADFLGWTDAAHASQAFNTSLSDTRADMRGRTVRPWGAGVSVGCWQAQSVAQDTSSVITGGGANSLKINGAGEVSLYIPVDAAGFTVSVTTESTTYGGTNYPQLTVVANPSIGVTSDTTATASSATEQTITTATITPTAKGVMEARLISRSTTTTSATYFDLLAAA